MDVKEYLDSLSRAHYDKKASGERLILQGNYSLDERMKIEKEYADAVNTFIKTHSKAEE